MNFKNLKKISVVLKLYQYSDIYNITYGTHVELH